MNTVRKGLRAAFPLAAATLLYLSTLSVSSAYAEHTESGPPQQVSVSVKIIEFQATKGVETGLSTYFSKLPSAKPFGQVGGAALNTADVTFPTSTAAAITVFIDRIRLDQGDIEVVLQALVDENRAFILSKPRAMVMVGGQTPTIVETTLKIPYENTVVVGSTAKQITQFEDTGVSLTLFAPEVIDEDGDWGTTDDTYIRLDVRVSVKEEGQRIVVALDDAVTSPGDSPFISVPEFISRSIQTHVWVRNNQVLMLGGLYRNTDSKNLTTLPWLGQAESAAVGALDTLLPVSLSGAPLSSTLGNRKTNTSRRELVFLIKAEVWRPYQTISSQLGLPVIKPDEQEELPEDLITEVPLEASGEESGDAP